MHKLSKKDWRNPLFGLSAEPANRNSVVIATCSACGSQHPVAFYVLLRVANRQSRYVSAYHCPRCSRSIREFKESRRGVALTTESFIAKARLKHGDKYDYGSTNYIDTKTKVSIICQHHGQFEQTPNSHLKGRGCPKCGAPKKNDWVKKFSSLHNGAYDYMTPDDLRDLGAKCREHGPFLVSRRAHLNGSGCPKCAAKAKHGEFKQIAGNHLRGNGCPRCAAGLSTSSGQHAVAEFIRTLIDDEIIVGDRELIAPYELDIYVPSRSLAIEYHGGYYHSYNRPERSDDIFKHSFKHEKCASNGITLLQFFEHEWLLKGDIVRSVIANKLGKSRRVYARNCQLMQIDGNAARAFFDSSHLSGHRNASVYVGLCLDGIVMCAMAFSRHSKYDYELIRFATLLNHVVVGGGSRLLNWFLSNYKPRSLLSYADRRHSTGNFYRSYGFAEHMATKPGYMYWKSGRVYSRQKFQKHKLASVLPVFDPDKSESQNMFANGYRRLWDAGHFKFVYENH